MNKFFRPLFGLTLLALFIVGCSKEGEPISSLLILSAPQYDAAFATNGRFSLSLVALTEDSTVINIEDVANIEFEIDSVVPAGTYAVTVEGVDFFEPSADKIAVGLLLDSSGSMDSSDPGYLRVSASKTFIDLLAANNLDNMASVADFGSSAPDSAYYFRLLQEYVEVTNTTDLFAALDSVMAYGSTPLYSGVHRDLDYTDGAVAAASYSRALVVLTDGQENDSYPEDSLESAIALANLVNIPVYTVGLGSGVDAADLTRLAQETGGIYVFADSASALEAIYTAMGYGLSQGYNTTAGVFGPIPPAGTQVFATVKVNSGGETASATIVFDIP